MKPFDVAKKHYAFMAERISEARSLLGRPLTFAEKILFSHVKGFQNQKFEPKKILSNNQQLNYISFA